MSLDIENTSTENPSLKENLKDPEIKKLLRNEKDIIKTIIALHGENSNEYKKAIILFEEIRNELPDTKFELENLKEEISNLQEKEISKNESFELDEKKLNKNTLQKNVNIFMNSNGNISHLTNRQIGLILSNVYALDKKLGVVGTIDKFIEKLRDNPENLIHLSKNWNKNGGIDRLLRFKASEGIDKLIIKNCISGAQNATNKEIDNFINKIDLDKEGKDKLKNEIRSILKKVEKTGDSEGLRKISILLSEIKGVSKKDSLNFTAKLGIKKKAEIYLKKIQNDEEIEKLKITNPDLYETIKKLQSLSKKYEIEKSNDKKKKIADEIKPLEEKLNKISKNETNYLPSEVKESISNSVAYAKFDSKIDENIKIYKDYGKNEKSAEVFLTAIKSNDSVSLSTIDQAIKEQKIDIKSGKIDEKFLSYKGEINNNIFTKEQFNTINSDTSGFLQDLPKGTEIPVGQTSNIVKKEDGNYNIKIESGNYKMPYSNIDKLKAKELISYINLLDEIGLSHLSPQILNNLTILDELGIKLDGTQNGIEEKKKLLKYSWNLFFPNENSRDDLGDLKRDFEAKKDKFSNGFKQIAINDNMKNPDKSIFDENGMLKIKNI